MLLKLTKKKHEQDMNCICQARQFRLEFAVLNFAENCWKFALKIIRLEWMATESRANSDRRKKKNNQTQDFHFSRTHYNSLWIPESSKSELRKKTTPDKYLLHIRMCADIQLVNGVRHFRIEDIMRDQGSHMRTML